LLQELSDDNEVLVDMLKVSLHMALQKKKTQVQIFL
jgi:hypothetical protein